MLSGRQQVQAKPQIQAPALQSQTNVASCPQHSSAANPPAPGTCAHCEFARIHDSKLTHRIVLDMCNTLTPRTINFQQLDQKWGMRVEAIVMRLAYAAAQGMRMAELEGVDLDTQYEVMALSMNGKGMGIQEALEKVKAEREVQGEATGGFKM